MIAAAVGFNELIARAEAGHWGETIPVLAIFFIALLGGTPLGLILIYVRGNILNWVAGFFGGKGNADQTIKAVTWAGVPLIIGTVFQLFLTVVGGQSAFGTLQQGTTDDRLKLLMTAAALFVGGIGLMAATLWFLILLVAGLSQVQKISTGKAFAVVLIWFALATLVSILIYKHPV